MLVPELGPAPAPVLELGPAPPLSVCPPCTLTPRLLAAALDSGLGELTLVDEGGWGAGDEPSCLVRFFIHLRSSLMKGCTCGSSSSSRREARKNECVSECVRLTAAQGRVRRMWLGVEIF